MRDISVHRWNPDDYMKHSSAQQQWAQGLIAKLELYGHERLLDIGCGDGKVTAEIAAVLPDGSVTGIDSSEEMIAHCMDRFPHELHPSIRFIVMDALDLRFDSEFDIVFSNAALHWVIDHGRVLAGIKRALRPGGRMLIQMAGKGNAADVFAVCDGMLAERRWGEFFEGFTFPYGFYDTDEYRLWLSQAGLMERRIGHFEKTMTQQGRDGLASWIRTTWLPYTERIPEELRSAFIFEIADRYIERFPPGPDGAVSVRMMRLEVEAINE